MDMFKCSSIDFINHCIRQERLNAIEHDSGIRNGIKEDGNNGEKTNRAVTKSKVCFSIITGMENQNKGKEYHEENTYRSRNRDPERNATRYYDSNNEETSATTWYQYNDTSTAYHKSPPPLIDERIIELPIQHRYEEESTVYHYTPNFEVLDEADHISEVQNIQFSQEDGQQYSLNTDTPSLDYYEYRTNVDTYSETEYLTDASIKSHNCNSYASEYLSGNSTIATLSH
jgi:hypothetical protein